MIKLIFLQIILLSISGCTIVSRDFDADSRKDSGPDLSAEEKQEIMTLRLKLGSGEARSKMGNASPYKVLGKTYNVLPDNKGYREIGLASWYGKKFHGRTTSNGERFDMYGLSAAHRSLVLPAIVRVENLNNGKSILVRVNDRGPFHGDRLIDLSVAAAIQLGFYELGLARVKVEFFDGQELSQFFFIEVQGFEDKEEAEAFIGNIKSLISSESLDLGLGEISDSEYFVTLGPLKEGDELDKFVSLISLMDIPDYRLVAIDRGKQLN